MKMAKKFMMLAVMAAFAGTMSAQVVSEESKQDDPVAVTTESKSRKVLTNAELSEQYKLQLIVIDNEIKTIKSKAKLYKNDAAVSAELATELATKKAELSEIKTKKKIADKAVKTEKASKKAAEKAEKAQKKAAAAAAKAAVLQK